MPITLSPEVSQAIESRIREFNCVDPNEIVLQALRSLNGYETDCEDLDEETRAAIDRAESQLDIPADQAERRFFSRASRKTLNT